MNGQQLSRAQGEHTVGRADPRPRSASPAVGLPSLGYPPGPSGVLGDEATSHLSRALQVGAVVRSRTEKVTATPSQMRRVSEKKPESLRADGKVLELTWDSQFTETAQTRKGTPHGHSPANRAPSTFTKHLLRTGHDACHTGPVFSADTSLRASARKD